MPAHLKFSHAVVNHIDDALRPADGVGELLQQVVFDFQWVSMRQGIHVLKLLANGFADRGIGMLLPLFYSL